jgi:hypothetical protein
MASSDSRMTVVVATYNRRDEMLRTLERLTGLPERPPIIIRESKSSGCPTISVPPRATMAS